MYLGDRKPEIIDWDDMKKYNRGKNNTIVRKAWNGEEGVKTIRALDRFDAKAVPIAAMSANAFEHVTEEGNR